MLQDGDKGDRRDRTEKLVEIYTDGSCIGNPGSTGLGIVFRSGKTTRIKGLPAGFGTSQTAELKAVINALETLRGNLCKVIIYTDSQLVFGFLRQGWYAKKNKAIVAKMRKLATLWKCEIVKVKGHGDNYHHNVADKLARNAARSGEVCDLKWREGDVGVEMKWE